MTFHIEKLEPAFGPLNQLVTIHGYGFGEKQNSSIVNFGIVSAQINSWSDTKIEATFMPPSQTKVDYILVEVVVNGEKSNGLPFRIGS